GESSLPPLKLSWNHSDSFHRCSVQIFKVRRSKMRRLRMFQLLGLIVVLAMVLSACTTVQPGGAPAAEPAATEAAAPEADGDAIGSEAHPIKVLFVPSVDANVIVSGGELMAEALKEATGLNFTVSVPTSYAAT